MARVFKIFVATYLLLLGTKLLALACCVLALARTMALFLAKMRAAAQLLLADHAARYVFQEARLVLQRLLPAHASLLDQERTLRACFVILVAVVCHLSMPALLCSVAGKATWRRFCAAWQRRLQHSPATVTRHLFKNGFSTSAAGTTMTQVLIVVDAAFQQPTALPSANVLGFEIVADGSRRGVQRTRLALGALPLDRFPLSRTAALVAIVAPTAQPCTANSHTVRWLFLALMADALRSCSSASA